MIVLQPTPNDISTFNNYSRNLDLSNTSIGNFSQIPSQSIPSSMYQTAATSQYSQPSFVYDQSSNTGNAMNPQPDTKSSTLQQNASNTNISPDSSNVLPPLSEVFPTSSTASSPTQSQVQQVQTQQQQQVANAAAAAAAQNGFFQPAMYSDVNAAASYAAAAAEGANYGNAQNPLMSQAQQQSLGQAAAQIASNIPVDPRTLPGIQTAAMLDPTRRNSSNALLAINTGLTMGAPDQSPLSASSAGSPIVYQHPAAAHQALLNSHFMAATQSMNNSVMMSQRPMNGHRSKGFRTDDDLASAGERPQKVYSFVALPGINTKKRPRRRYDEIERHYACNFPGCTKSYGTLNHLNAHVQMQKHGPKRHPSEFKELRKQWRRQKREEEERKAAEVAAAKNAVASLNISSLQSI